MFKRLLVCALFFGLSSCGDNVREHSSIDDNNGASSAGYGAAGEGRNGAVAGAIDGGSLHGGTQLEAGLKVSYEADAINDPGNVLSRRVFYFAYDSNDVSEQDIELIKHHGRYLAMNPKAKLRLEGHADERGTREYNIALGERRARAVRELLLYEAAGEEQITVISYGEEKPVAFGQDEESMQMNRRVEIVYQ